MHQYLHIAIDTAALAPVKLVHPKQKLHQHLHTGKLQLALGPARVEIAPQHMHQHLHTAIDTTALAPAKPVRPMQNLCQHLHTGKLKLAPGPACTPVDIVPQHMHRSSCAQQWIQLAPAKPVHPKQNSRQHLHTGKLQLAPGHACTRVDIPQHMH